jgi:hypothetical protein
MPLGATTPSAALGRAPQITGAPITQTPAPGRVKASRSGLVLGGITALALLGIGIGVLVKVLGKAESPTVREVATGESKLEPTISPGPVEPATTAAKPPAEPPATAAPSALPVETSVKPVAVTPPGPRRPPTRPGGKPKPQPSAKPGTKPPDDIGF